MQDYAVSYLPASASFWEGRLLSFIALTRLKVTRRDHRGPKY
jgi:hypothetical protein